MTNTKIKYNTRINCRICFTKILEHKKLCYGYCLDCLPNMLRCSVHHKNSGERCKAPTLPTTQLCKLHSNKKYKNHLA